MTKQHKVFVVRKYVTASSATDAIRKERRFQVDDVWIDEDWKKAQEKPPVEGFKAK